MRSSHRDFGSEAVAAITGLRAPRRRIDGADAADRSGGACYLDGHGDWVADDVPNGRVADQVRELGKLAVVEVAGGLHSDPDLLVARTHILVQAEEAAQVDVAVDRR